MEPPGLQVAQELLDREYPDTPISTTPGLRADNDLPPVHDVIIFGLVRFSRYLA